MSESVLEKLFAYNNWANLRIVETCLALSDRQLDAEPHSATKGTIRRTLVHLVTSQQYYLALLTLPLEARSVTPPAFADLEHAVTASGDALLVLARDAATHPPQDRLQTADGYYVEPWVIMVQVINHASEHREQIKSMLSALGVTPPEIYGWDYGEFTHALVPVSEPGT